MYSSDEELSAGSEGCFSLSNTRSSDVYAVHFSRLRTLYLRRRLRVPILDSQASDGGPEFLPPSTGDPFLYQVIGPNVWMPWLEINPTNPDEIARDLEELASGAEIRRDLRVFLDKNVPESDDFNETFRDLELKEERNKILHWEGPVYGMEDLEVANGESLTLDDVEREFDQYMEFPEHLLHSSRGSREEELLVKAAFDVQNADRTLVNDFLNDVDGNLPLLEAKISVPKFESCSYDFKLNWDDLNNDSSIFSLEYEIEELLLDLADIAVNYCEDSTRKNFQKIQPKEILKVENSEQKCCKPTEDSATDLEINEPVSEPKQKPSSTKVKWQLHMLTKDTTSETQLKEILKPDCDEELSKYFRNNSAKKIHSTQNVLASKQDLYDHNKTNRPEDQNTGSNGNNSSFKNFNGNVFENFVAKLTNDSIVEELKQEPFEDENYVANEMNFSEENLDLNFDGHFWEDFKNPMAFDSKDGTESSSFTKPFCSAKFHATIQDLAYQKETTIEPLKTSVDVDEFLTKNCEPWDQTVSQSSLHRDLSFSQQSGDWKHIGKPLNSGQQQTDGSQQSLSSNLPKKRRKIASKRQIVLPDCPF